MCLECVFLFPKIEYYLFVYFCQKANIFRNSYLELVMFTPHLQLQTRAESLSIRGQTFELNETMIMAVDVFEGAAKNDFDSAVQILSRRDGGPYVLLKEHTDAWASTWARGNIEVHSTSLFNFYDRYIFFKKDFK